MRYSLRPDILYMARHPEIFRGERKHHHYFEGWYYNLKTIDGEPFVVIPGISREGNGKGHAFVQIIDAGVSYNVAYDLAELSFVDEPFKIKIAKNEFTLFSVKLDINDNVRYQGELYFKNLINLKKTNYAPSIMGPFAYCPFMQCNHGILCMNADTKGKIDTGKKEMDFDNGSVYIEKDWGVSFPKKYVWVQCNSFEKSRVGLSLSIADVPFLGSNFRGVIAVLQRGKRQNIFASYYFVKLKKLLVTDKNAEIELKQGKFTLIVSVTAKDSVKLLAPDMGKMSESVYESVNSSVSVQMFYKNRLLYQGNGQNAAYEIRGY